MIDWRINLQQLPGPRDSWSRDAVFPSASNQFAIAIYASIEFRMGWEGAYFAVFRGPPDTPECIWCPTSNNCMFHHESWQWLEGVEETFALNAYLHVAKKELTDIPFLFVRPRLQQIAFFPMRDSSNTRLTRDNGEYRIDVNDCNPRLKSPQGIRIALDQLIWTDWNDWTRLRDEYWSGRFGVVPDGVLRKFE
jgi:hypothetical protein